MMTNPARFTTVVILKPGCSHTELFREFFPDRISAMEFVREQLDKWPCYYHFDYQKMLEPQEWASYNPEGSETKANPKSFIWLGSQGQSQPEFSNDPVKALEHFIEPLQKLLTARSRDRSDLGMIYIMSTIKKAVKDLYKIGRTNNRQELLYCKFNETEDHPIIVYTRLSTVTQLDELEILRLLSNFRVDNSNWVKINIDLLISIVTNYYRSLPARDKYS